VGHTKSCDGVAVMGRIVWNTLISPTLQIVRVAQIPAWGLQFLSESLSAFILTAAHVQ
jgi:hypothetical protein